MIGKYPPQNPYIGIRNPLWSVENFRLESVEVILYIVCTGNLKQEIETIN